MSNKLAVVFGVALLTALPSAPAFYFTNTDGSVYTCGTNLDGMVNIAGYAGPPWTPVIPTNIDGMTVTTIGFNAFGGLANLTSITIADTIGSIGQLAFEYCTSLSTIALPASVTNLQPGAMALNNLTAITVNAGNSFFSASNGILFDVNRTVLLQYPGGSNSAGGNFTVPAGVTALGDYAFAGSPLANVVISAGVGSIGSEAFENCVDLTNVTLPDTVTNIGSAAFDVCLNLPSLTIPAGVTSVGEDAFSFCMAMTAVYAQCGTGAFGSALNMFFNDEELVIYYLPTASGWSSETNIDATTAPWNPQALVNAANFGVSTNQFGFTITNAQSELAPQNDTPAVVVVACTNLANPVWTALQTVTLTNGTAFFVDPQWSNYPGRFYSFTMP